MIRRTRIKICGLRDEKSARTAADAGADAIGLVFVERSPRFVTLEQARAVVAALPAFVDPVALFVDTSPARIAEVTDALGVRTVQLHGDEPIEVVKSLAPLQVVRALPADAPDEVLRPWQSVPNVSAVMLDAPRATEDALPGGSGRPFDWDALAARGATMTKPFVLAGGLTPDNVGQAMVRLHPYAVDVSSGVERQRGVKSAELIAAFCDAVRRADRS